MPARSEAQLKKYAELLREGKITQEQYDRLVAGTPRKLPKRTGESDPHHIAVVKTVKTAKIIK